MGEMPPDDVARGPLCRSRIGHRDPLGPERGRHRLEVELTRHGHDRDRQPGAGVDEQGLEHLLRRQPERLGRLEPERPCGRVVLVGVLGERDARRGECHRGGRPGRVTSRHATRYAPRSSGEVGDGCRVAGTGADERRLVHGIHVVALAPPALTRPRGGCRSGRSRRTHATAPGRRRPRWRCGSACARTTSRARSRRSRPGAPSACRRTARRRRCAAWRSPGR